MSKEIINYYQASQGGGGKNFGNQPNRQNQYSSSPTPRFDWNLPFFNDKGNLNTDWLDKKIQDLAQAMDMTNSQVRNFYNEFQRIQNIPLEAKDEKLALIKLLKAKAKYKQTNDKQRKFSPLFTEMINNIIDEIGNDIDKYNKACLIMEALVGYSKKG